MERPVSREWMAVDKVLKESGKDGALYWGGLSLDKVPCIWMGEEHSMINRFVSLTHSRCSLYTCEWMAPGSSQVRKLDHRWSGAWT